jgi:hypothetical protein
VLSVGIEVILIAAVHVTDGVINVVNYGRRDRLLP